MRPSRSMGWAALVTTESRHENSNFGWRFERDICGIKNCWRYKLVLVAYSRTDTDIRGPNCFGVRRGDDIVEIVTPNNPK